MSLRKERPARRTAGTGGTSPLPDTNEALTQVVKAKIIGGPRYDLPPIDTAFDANGIPLIDNERVKKHGRKRIDGEKTDLQRFEEAANRLFS